VEVPEIAEEWPEQSPGGRDAQWRNWLLLMHADKRGETPSRYLDHAVEATTEALVGAAAKFQIDFNPAFEKLTLHRVELRRAGQWQDRFDPDQVTLARREDRFESDMATGMVTALIVVSDVRPGDVVRYAYTVTGENPVLGRFTHLATPLEWIDPILVRRVVVDLGRDADVAWRVLGSAPAATVERRGDRTRVTWEGRSLAAFKPEQDTPAWYPAPATLQVALKSDWRNVSEWASTLYPGEPALPPELEARAAEWSTLDSLESRVLVALQTVQDEVRYFSVALGESSHRPSPPDVTWSRRYGDCKDKAWLLSVLLRRLGAEAVPALVNTQMRHGLADSLPSASQFDHVVVRARIDGRTYWLDPTMTHQRGPLALRQSVDFGLALPVMAGGTQLEPMSEAADVESFQSIQERLTIADDGASARLDVVTRMKGPPAVARRAEVQSRGAVAIGQSFADYYHKARGELSVLQPLSIEDDAQSGELVMREAYQFAQPWLARGGGERTLELLADQIAPLLRVEGGRERTAPLWTPHPLRAIQSLELKLPKGWRLLEAVDVGTYEDDHFAYRQTTKTQDDVLVIRHEFVSKAAEVPTSEVPTHVELKRQASISAGTRLRVGVPVDATKSDRDRRLRDLLREAASGR